MRNGRNRNSACGEASEFALRTPDVFSLQVVNIKPSENKNAIVKIVLIDANKLLNLIYAAEVCM
jgi:hypothetical protein